MYILASVWIIILCICSDGLSALEGHFFKSIAESSNTQQSNVPLANLEGEPSAYVHGCVNVITGQYCETNLDLVVYHPTDPLVFERIYLGSSEQQGMLGRGWTSNFSHAVLANFFDSKHDHHYMFRVFDSGSDFSYEEKPRHKQSTLGNIWITPETLTRGVTNTASGFINGQTNIKNLILFARYDRDHLQVKSGNGSVKSFSYSEKNDGWLLYRLDTDKKANGNIIFYRHPTKKSNGMVELYDSKNNRLGKMITPPISEGNQPTTKKYFTDDGRWVCYTYDLHNKKDLLLDKVESSNGPTTSYVYDTNSHIVDSQSMPLYYRIDEKRLPDDRLLKVEYHKYEATPPDPPQILAPDIFKPFLNSTSNKENSNGGLNSIFLGKENPPYTESNKLFLDFEPYTQSLDAPYCTTGDPSAFFDRVKTLKAPAGHDATPITIYRFDYDLHTVTPKNAPPDMKVISHGSCRVLDALGYYTRYNFNIGLRIESIERQCCERNAYTKETLYWGNPLANDDTFLRARTFAYKNNLIFARTFEYDHFGNVQKETLLGNLSGHNPISPAINKEGYITPNGCDAYIKTCEYSNEGLNLLMHENDGFKATTYQYYPGTGLLKAKFEGTEKERLRRWYYYYNQSAVLVKEITDDGFTDNPDDLSGVSERQITYYTPTKSYPVGMPEVIEEKCYNMMTCREELVHKTVNTYTKLAKISKQEHYDSQGELVYTLLWDYDKYGNVIKETDAIGQITTRNYDDNSNCIYEQGPDLSYHKDFKYDYMNRLIKIEEHHPDGVFSTSHHYDLKSNRIATIDSYGNETNFKYDPSGRVIKTTFPAFVNEDGKVKKPVVRKTYDPMGSPSIVKDAKEVETHRTYNIRGEVASVTYPDGRSEKKTYQLNGTLIETVDCNNTKTRFTNDCFGRPLKIEIFSASGELLTAMTATYNAFHVLTETDPMGEITQYCYYSDGKLKSKQKGDNLITYIYDSLKRIAKTKEQFGPNPDDVVVKVYEYDLLDRVKRESTEDAHGHVLTLLSYNYDSEGRIKSTTSYGSEGESVVTTEYDTHGIPYIVTDGDNNKTVTQCRYDYFNSIGQNVAYKEITDPMGNSLTVICDALSREVKKIRKDPFGKITQEQEITYDANGNVVRLADLILTDDKNEGKIITCMQYDTDNRLTLYCEAYGAPEQKTSKIVYNQNGEKSCLIKNSGQTLNYTYDPLGRLETLVSSDNTINYKYTYDPKGNFRQAKDLATGAVTTREFDINDNIRQETLSHGFSVDYRYDGIGRPLQIDLHDGSSFVYSYDANFLRSISRKDSSGNTLYAHRYVDYDQSGRILKSELAGKAGTAEYAYYKSGRLKEIAATHWKETIKRYNSAGNIECRVIAVDDDSKEDNYEYDALHQLLKESGCMTRTYTYDSHYNRRSTNGTTHYFNLLHQLNDDGTYKYTYDQNGNLKETFSDTSTTTYGYDALDRLTSVRTNLEKVCYEYDPMDRRICKSRHQLTNDGSWSQVDKIHFLYQGQNEIGAVDADGKIIELRVLGIGKGAEIGAAVAIEIGSKFYVPIHDQAGSVACLLDGATGDLVESYRYTAYGKEEFEDALTPWRFASKRTDDETGLVYFGKRYYNPETGRWITPDPLGREGGPNLYTYLLNNPLNGCDHYGLFSIWDSMCMGFNTVFDRLASGFNRIGNAFNRATYLFSQFWKQEFPIPILRDGFSAIHYLITKGTFSGYKMEYQGEHSNYGKVYGVDYSFKAVTGVVTGVDNTRESTIEAARRSSAAIGGGEVYFLANATHGKVTDVGETICQKTNIHTNSVMQCVNMVYQMFSDAGPNARIRLEGHSQGGQIIDCLRYILPIGMRNRIDVITYGSAKMVSNKHFGSAVNYVSSRDLVPLVADPLGILQSRFSNDIDVRFLSSDGIPLMDHPFGNKVYHQAQENSGWLFLQNLSK